MAGRFAKWNLTDDEITRVRALLHSGISAKTDIANELGYRRETFSLICGRQREVREIFEQFKKQVTPYCVLAKTKPKPRSSKAGRKLREIPEHRIPDIEHWASVGYTTRRIADEMRIPLIVFNRQAKADPRLIEAFELGKERHAHQMEQQIQMNGKDPGLMFLLKAKHGHTDKPATVNDNRTQIVHVSINEAMPREKFLEYIDA